MKEPKKYGAIGLIARVYFIALSSMALFRLILFVNEQQRIDFTQVETSTILKAFIMGIRFDLVIIGYIMILPALVLLIMNLIKNSSDLIIKMIFYFVLFLFSISFLICAADIPFFSELYSRFSVMAFDWFDSPKFVFDMIRQEPKYFLIVIPLIILIYVFYKILRNLFRHYSPTSTKLPLKIFSTLLICGLIVLGIRGRLNMNAPIKVGTAYFCNHSFLNQLGLNPVFTFIRSYLDAQKKDNEFVQVMEPNRAFRIVRECLNVEDSTDLNSIAQRISYQQERTPKKANIIYIIMESMSAAKMARHGNTKKLTPFLDSLVNEGLYFENHYSAGIHTYNGIFTTLFSFPALYRQRIMDNIKYYNGIGTELERHGYSTTYFTTHDAQFDNMAGFLTANGFDQIISDEHYPLEEIKTAMGVTDNFMFQFAMPILDSLHKSGKPFFTTFMTGSDHGPYYIPEYFKARNAKVEDQAVEFADWSLSQFIQRCSSKDWYENTLFVFVADHGKPIDVRFTIPLNFCHTPLLFFAPKLIDSNSVLTKPANQMDIYPTTMSILNLPYFKNNLGIDLLTQTRPYAIFNYDDRIGVIDEDFLLVLRKSGERELFKYRNTMVQNIIEQHPEKVQDMQNYAYAHMQVFQEMLKQNSQFKEEKK